MQNRRRRRLQDILQRDGKGYFGGWNNVQAAKEFGPLPAGEYLAEIVDKELFATERSGTPGVKFTFEVAEGEYQNRHFWLDLWLTENAKSQTKRDLDKLGITDPESQLDMPLPARIRCSVHLVVRKSDSGIEYNQVRGFNVVEVLPLVRDPFAPPVEPSSGGIAESTNGACSLELSEGKPAESPTDIIPNAEGVAP